MNLFSGKYLRMCAVLLLALTPFAAAADGSNETGMGIVLEGQNTVKGMKIDGGFFKLTRTYSNIGNNEASIKKEFIKMKVDVPYEVKLVDQSDSTEKIIATRKGVATLKPGSESVTVNLDKEVKQLLAAIKKKGVVSVHITVPGNGEISCISSSIELSMYNEKYQKEQMDNSAKNADKYQKFAEDYQKYLMDNAASGKDSETLMKDFYKKYPQYKGMMPE